MNQAHPIELRGSFLGVAVGEYQHSNDHRELVRAREFAALLEGFGYRPTVLENPTICELRTGLREWRQRPDTARSPVLLAWSGRATAVGDVLRLAARDTSAASEPDCSYRPESLVENALGSGADQILLLIDTCRADRDAVHAVRVALGDWAKRTCPPGGAGWLGVLANCPGDDTTEDTADDQDAVGSGILLEAAGRLLRAGPSSGTYRRAWSVQNAGITGQELLQTLRDELADDEQPLVHVESGTARVMFPNPRWRPAQVMFPNPRWRPVQRPHLVEHLVAASRGAAPQDEGWFFTGRRAVLGQIVAWMHTEAPGAFVVTGSAGCGKSAVLGRIVALSETAERAALLEHAPLEPADPDPRLGAIDAAVHLRGMGALDLATALADCLGLPAPESCWQLVAAVATTSYPPILVLDGVDEAIPEQVDKIVTDLLAPLAVVASVLLATRHQEFPLGRPTAGEPGFVRLGELFGPATPVVDLDVEAGTAEDIERYVASRLRSAGRAELVERVAPVLGEMAAAGQGGFLYARLVVAQILRQVVDVCVERWEQQLPTTIPGALDHELASGVALVRDGAELPGAARDLLRALAWGLGRGIPGRGVWEAAATALSPDGVQYQAADLDWVLEHYGPYILEDGQDGEALYRLYHQEFVEHLVESSPPVAGRPAAQALADALVTLARAQSAGEPDRCSPYLRRHLARHAAMAGAPGVTALHRLAEGNPEAYLPDLATSLHNLASRLVEMGRHEAALGPAQHAAETYRVLATANPAAYVADLALTLNNVAVYLSAIGRHQDALAPGAEAADTFRVLAEAYPEDYLTDLVTSLKNLTGHLAALDRISDAVDIYTSSVETFVASPAARDALIIERAGFHISHGDVPTGLRELVTLLTSEGTETPDGTPDAITLAARNALRAHRARNALAVHHAWREVSGTEPPNWLALTAEQICIAVEWIVAPNWAGSKDFFAAHVEELLAPPATIALEELQLLVSPRADQHQLLLEDIRERGIDAAYRPLLLADLLTDWISVVSWQDSRSFAEEHAADLLTGEAEIALFRLGQPTATVVHLALLRLARREGIAAAYACVTDRRFAADRMQRALAEVEPDPIAELAALEGQVFGERFLAAAHLAVAASLMGEVMTDTTGLEELAEQADLADRQRVAAEIAELAGRVPEHAGLLDALPGVLLRPTPT